jgi:hypothetical protein
MASVIELIGNVALGDPLATVLLAVGALLFAVSFGAFGYLAAGAAISLVTPS